ncbi:MAG: TonB-dependent receptor [Bacteroidetes bacterium]|nr:TonB-dependent receptor [Bacteroidota bacterium]
MRKSFILLALLCRQLTVFSQYTVSGTVKDENNNALSGANVIVENTFRGTTTNADGEFKLTGLRTGVAILKFSFLGYETETRKVDVNTSVIMNVNLKRSVVMADEVVVVATRANRNTPVAHSTLTRENIRQQNQGQDIPYMLALTPSLVTSSDAGAGVGYTSFRIRGTDLNRINVTMNGIPLNDAESHGVWWVDLPDVSSSVDNVQIQRGVGTSTVGAGAFGASINLQTFSFKKEAHGEINSAYGSFNTFKNTVSVGSGLIGNHFTFDTRVSKITSDGFIDRASSDLKSLHVSASYRDKKNLLRFNLLTGTEKTYQAWDGIPGDILKSNRRYNNLGAYYDDSDNLRYYENQTDNYQQDHYQIQYSRELTSALNFSTSLHYTKGLGYYEEYKDDAKLTDYNLQKIIIKDSTISQTDLVRRKWLDNDFYGITYALNYDDGKTTFNLGGGWNNYYGEHYGNVIWAQYFSNGEPDHQYYYSDGNKTDFNIFSKLGYKITSSLHFFGDLQFRRIVHDMKGIDDDQRDITQKHTFKFFNPKAGLTFNIGDNQNIYGFWGIANREPTRSNFVDADPGKPFPVSEKMLDYEFGYTLNGNMVKANVNLYYMDYYDQLVLTGEINDVGSPVMSNVDRSFRQGVEISASLQPLQEFGWSGNITISRNKIKKYADHIDNWDYWNDPENQPLQYIKEMGETEIAFSPGIIASSQFKYQPFPRLLLSFNSKYVGKQYIDNTANENRVLNPYLIHDLRLNSSWEILEHVNLETILTVNNLFNKEYETNAWLYQYIEGNENKNFERIFFH